jgi:hypothetical protein
MDRVRQFLEEVKQGDLARGNFLGLLNVLIGRRLARKDGTVLSEGITWRDMAAHLKKARWDKQAVKELGLVPEALPPRDRLRYWYGAIVQASVDSPRATQAGNEMAAVLERLGYRVGHPPAGAATPIPSPPEMRKPGE